MPAAAADDVSREGPPSVLPLGLPPLALPPPAPTAPAPARGAAQICVLGDAKHCEEAEKIGVEKMSVDDLKKLNKNKKLVNRLAKKHHLFLASESVIKQIPRLLGARPLPPPARASPSAPPPLRDAPSRRRSRRPGPQQGGQVPHPGHQQRVSGLQGAPPPPPPSAAARAVR